MLTPEHAALCQLLHPGRFPGMGGKMAAIVGCILGVDYTRPGLEELCVTSDGMVLARAEGDCGMNEIVGRAFDLERNWTSLLECAGLDETQKGLAMEAYRGAVKDWRKV